MPFFIRGKKEGGVLRIRYVINKMGGNMENFAARGKGEEIFYIKMFAGKKPGL